MLDELVDMQQISELPGFEEATPDLVDAVIEEAAKVAGDLLSPLNWHGDVQGSHLVDGKVVVPEGFNEAYKNFVEGGWLGLSQDPEYGGQGLPHTLYCAVSEMWNSANLAFALNPLLTSGAIEALDAHASDQLKQRYLPQMIAGEWSGVMVLTEPQAGSDLSAVRSKATPNGDHYLIEGQKIFISWGDHEMADNVIQLVLARLPDAPAGVKGISLFLVPKFLVNEDGSLGDRNDVYAVSLEHKMGLHASPTCVMSYGDKGGAVGYLVGEENQGLAHMFTMMNEARLAVGLQGLAVAQRAYQKAKEYACDRVQGPAPGVQGKAGIIHHPDVRRMLMLMRVLTESSRAIGYVTAAAADRAHNSTDSEQAAYYQQRLDLLVPIAKAWCTESSIETTNLGVQIHGGMGYVEETGVAQYVRDARVLTIYEGTTGIQAMDLVGRKFLRDQGQGMSALIAEMEDFASAMDASEMVFADMQKGLCKGIDTLKQAASWLLAEASSDPRLPGAAAHNLLMLVSTVFGAYLMVKSAVAAQRRLGKGAADTDFCHGKIVSARFYCSQVLSRSSSHLEIIQSGADALMALSEEQF